MKSYASLVEEYLPGMSRRPGAAEALAEAAGSGLVCALVSGSSRKWNGPLLRRFALEPFFTVMCTRDDVERSKPAPDLYLTALRRLGIAPSEAMAIEDAPNGAMAATEAGVRCIVIPNEMTKRLHFPDLPSVRKA